MKKNTKITCIEPKHYNLTRGEEYTLIKEDDKYYHVINNRGLDARYYKSLFEDNRPVSSNVASIIKSIVVRETSSNQVSVTYDIGGGRNKRISCAITTTGTSISCGIHQLYNINSLISSILYAVTGKDKNAISGAIFKKVIKYKLTKSRTSYFLLSTNTNATGFKIMDKELDAMAEYSTQRRNPNSSNTIKLWILRK